MSWNLVDKEGWASCSWDGCVKVVSFETVFLFLPWASCVLSVVLTILLVSQIKLGASKLIWIFIYKSGPPTAPPHSSPSRPTPAPTPQPSTRPLRPSSAPYPPTPSSDSSISAPPPRHQTTSSSPSLYTPPLHPPQHPTLHHHHHLNPSHPNS